MKTNKIKKHLLWMISEKVGVFGLGGCKIKVPRSSSLSFIGQHGGCSEDIKRPMSWGEKNDSPSQRV